MTKEVDMDRYVVPSVHAFPYKRQLVVGGCIREPSRPGTAYNLEIPVARLIEDATDRYGSGQMGPGIDS